MQFEQYRRKQIAELRPYQNGESMEGISVSAEDTKAGSPKEGDMIARNPANHADQWLVAAAYFAVNFEPATGVDQLALILQRLDQMSETLDKILYKSAQAASSFPPNRPLPSTPVLRGGG